VVRARITLLERSVVPGFFPALVVLTVLLLTTALSAREAQQAWRFPGLTAAQGAFAVHRPYEAFTALGHLVPGAEYLLLGDPEAQPSPWGGSRLWHEEQFIGTARASDVVWLPDVSGPMRHEVVPVAARIWSGYNTLFGSIEVLVVDPSARTFVVHHVTEGGGVGEEGLTRIVDLRLLDAASRAVVDAAFAEQRR
jgi:hypothetical protein